MNGSRLVSWTIGNRIWRLPPQYRFKKQLGSGAYGAVASFQDTRRKQVVAIKHIAEVFRDPLDAKRILRELNVLRHLRGCKHVTKILDVLDPGSPDFEEIYIVMECADNDINNVIYSEHTYEDNHCRYIFYDLLKAFAIIHRAGIVHRDVKPSNLLMNMHDCGVRICDFGLARRLGPPICERTAASRPSPTANGENSLMFTPKQQAHMGDTYSPLTPFHQCTSRVPTAASPSDLSGPPLSQCRVSGRAEGVSTAASSAAESSSWTGENPVHVPTRRLSCGALTKSMSLVEDPPKQVTEYVITRWYRPPEVLMNSGQYDFSVDIWGIGCIMAEVVRRSPLFPGKDNRDQLRRIFALLGRPDDLSSLMLTPQRQASREARQVRELANKLTPSLPAPHLRRELRGNLGICADDLFDLMIRLLAISPQDRPAAEEALQHRYFAEQQAEEVETYKKEYHIVNREVTYAEVLERELIKVQPIDWSFDSVPLLKKSIQQRIYQEIATHYHPEIVDRDRQRLACLGAVPRLRSQVAGDLAMSQPLPAPPVPRLVTNSSTGSAPEVSTGYRAFGYHGTPYPTARQHPPPAAPAVVAVPITGPITTAASQQELQSAASSSSSLSANPCFHEAAIEVRVPTRRRQPPDTSSGSMENNVMGIGAFCRSKWRELVTRVPGGVLAPTTGFGSLTLATSHNSIVGSEATDSHAGAADSFSKHANHQQRRLGIAHYRTGC